MTVKNQCEKVKKNGEKAMPYLFLEQ